MKLIDASGSEQCNVVVVVVGLFHAYNALENDQRTGGPTEAEAF